MITIEQEYLPLLESLSNGSQNLHMGRTPVKAIELAWQWEKDGLVSIDSNSDINITDKGREVLKSQSEVNDLFFIQACQ